MRYTLLLIFIFALCITAATVSAQSGLDCKSGQCIYTPLEPLPTGSANAQSGQNFPAFMSGIFRVLISFGGLFAVVMLVVAGIGYMLSESALDIDKAKGRAKAALWGLLLLTGSWLILNTINPKLLDFSLFNDALNRQRTSTTEAPGSRAGVPGTPTQITVNRIQVGESVKIEDGPGSYEILMNYYSQCLGNMTESVKGAGFTTWTCVGK